MTLSRTLMLSSAIALIATVPAYADLTAEQVLADQLRQVEQYGLTATVTGESRSGDTLTIEGFTATGDIPEGSFSMTVPANETAKNNHCKGRSFSFKKIMARMAVTIGERY